MLPEEEFRLVSGEICVGSHVQFHLPADFEYADIRPGSLETGVVLRLHSNEGVEFANVQMDRCPWRLNTPVSELTFIPNPVRAHLENHMAAGLSAIRACRLDVLEQVIGDIIEKPPRILWLAANGGSATICEHLETEWNLVARLGLAVALTRAGSSLTCAVNDWPAEEVFARGLVSDEPARDWLWLFSGSGTSPNLLAAAKKAKSLGLRTYAFTGKPRAEGEHLADLVDNKIVVPLTAQDQLETAFAWIAHAICYYWID